VIHGHLSYTAISTTLTDVTQRNPALAEFVDDVLQVPNAPCQPIEPGHYEGVFRPKKVEQDLELGPAVASRAACLFSPDDVAACHL
jgi:hypothetical protein